MLSVHILVSCLSGGGCLRDSLVGLLNDGFFGSFLIGVLDYLIVGLFASGSDTVLDLV